VVIHKFENLATRSASDGDLLLFYYFGHGDLSSDLKLVLLHKGSQKGTHDRVSLEQFETRVSVNEVPKSLFLLDCCYAGGVDRTFPYTLRGDHCRIAATAPSSKAYVLSGTVEDPIGSFTSAFMDSFTTPEACVSNADDRVTATSLYEYLQRVLADSEGGRVQRPTMQGSLPDALFEHKRAPILHPGYSRWANEKTAYAKIVVICRAMLERKFPDISSLHNYLVKRYRASFETLYKQENGKFEYMPVSYAVVARYVGLMQRIDLLENGQTSLSHLGKLLASNWEKRGNELLLKAVDTYLTDRGMNRDELIDATRRVLKNRRIPTKHEVADTLFLTGYRLPKSDVGVLLDLFAYAGVVRVAEQRAYFPW
jgi:hypothetical protein